MALLLGGDYANGVKGVGPVNAMEILQAFHFPHLEEDAEINVEHARNGLARFEKWLDIAQIAPEDAYGKRFADRHRAARARWEAPPAFPSRDALVAYLRPRVADAAELAKATGQALEAWDPDAGELAKLFAWRPPNEQALRRRCALDFGWADRSIDAVVNPVLDANERRAAGRQRRVDAYFESYHAQKKNADFESKRLRRALAEGAPEPKPAKKAKKRRRGAVAVEEDDEDEEDDDADAPAPPRTAPRRTAAARAKRRLEEAAED